MKLAGVRGCHRSGVWVACCQIWPRHDDTDTLQGRVGAYGQPGSGVKCYVNGTQLDISQDTKDRHVHLTRPAPGLRGHSHRHPPPNGHGRVEQCRHASQGIHGLPAHSECTVPSAQWRGNVAVAVAVAAQ
jgi:hypothetical protein